MISSHRPDSSVGRVLGSGKLEVVGSIPATSKRFFFHFFSLKNIIFFALDLQSFLKLLTIFPEFVEAIQNPQSFRIFFKCLKTIVFPEVVKHFSRSPTKSPKLQNSFSSIYKHSSTF